MELKREKPYRTEKGLAPKKEMLIHNKA